MPTGGELALCGPLGHGAAGARRPGAAAAAARAPSDCDRADGRSAAGSAVAAAGGRASSLVAVLGGTRRRRRRAPRSDRRRPRRRPSTSARYRTRSSSRSWPSTPRSWPMRLRARRALPRATSELANAQRHAEEAACGPPRWRTGPGRCATSGWTTALLGDPEQGEGLLVQSLALDPSNRDGLYYLGRVRFELLGPARPRHRAARAAAGHRAWTTSSAASSRTCSPRSRSAAGVGGDHAPPRCA